MFFPNSRKNFALNRRNVNWMTENSRGTVGLSPRGTHFTLCIYKCTLVLCWSTFIVIKSLDLFVYVCVWSLRKQVSGLSSTMSQLAPQRGCTPPDTLNTHPWASSPTTGPIPTIGWVWGRTGDGGGEARAFSTSQMCQYNIFTLQLLITNTELQHCCTWAAPE